MENLAKPPFGFFRQTSLKRFLFALLAIAALSGAFLVTHSSPAAACGYTCNGGHPWQGDGE